jgi:Na+-transporting methylmalonyl-CoA/oxaloacetate decarboxylase gamma subunit
MTLPLHEKDGYFMDNLTKGLVLTVIGMGGTLLSLWLLTLIIQVLKKFFPYSEAEEKSGKEVV